jgi:hypothetical protein
MNDSVRGREFHTDTVVRLEDVRKTTGNVIDSGIDLSITIDKIRVFINKTLSTLSVYQ